MMNIFDSTKCELGEGVFWHPKRQTLFWFDIMGKRLYERKNQESQARQWQFEDYVSAAAWIDHDHLLIASEKELFIFNLENEVQKKVASLEADNPVTRSNDGRADPYGGFWIGTMGKNAEEEAGAIYRYYRGELRKLYSQITISNAICFSPNGQYGFFTDTRKAQIMRVALDEKGWPKEAPSLFLDLRTEGLSPDGAVVDQEGCLWVAQWGASRVAVYDQKGQFLKEIKAPTRQISCPAFGGRDFTTLFATSARQGMSFEDVESEPAGAVFSIQTEHQGQPEPAVQLDAEQLEDLA